MHSVVKYAIKKDHPLCEWMDVMARQSNNLYNTALFRIRQVLTGVKKEIMTTTEKSVLDEIDRFLPAMNQIRKNTWLKNKDKKLKLFEKPDKDHSFISYAFLESLMKTSKNPDYLALPAQTAQAVIKRAWQDVSNFFGSMREWKKCPVKFLSRPKLTRYKKKGCVSNIPFSNQDCVVHGDELKFPWTKTRFNIGDTVNGRKLSQAEVDPHHGVFTIILTFEDGIESPSLPEASERIASIDFGTENIAALANNVGRPGLLFKGGRIKSVNQLFNKKRAFLASCHAKQNNGIVNHNSRLLNNLSLKRDGFMHTELHTIAKKIINQCLEWKIDTLVLGINHLWKQNVALKKNDNQNFVGIPFSELQWYLKYRGERNGIRVVEQEESYNSKASFLDMDSILVYSPDNKEKYVFSGWRKKRGLYKIKDQDILVNADLNGAGNILRKAFPDAFDGCKGFVFLKEIFTGNPVETDKSYVDDSSGACPQICFVRSPAHKRQRWGGVIHGMAPFMEPFFGAPRMAGLWAQKPILNGQALIATGRGGKLTR